MKTFLILLTALLTQASSTTSWASEVLHCYVSAGGPTPGTATVVIQSLEDGQSEFQIQLVNHFYPQGIEGSYIAKLAESGDQLVGTGNLGGNGSNFFMGLEPDSEGETFSSPLRWRRSQH